MHSFAAEQKERELPLGAVIHRCAQSGETPVLDQFFVSTSFFSLLIQILSIIKIFFHDIRGEKQKPQKEMPVKHKLSARSAVVGLGKQLARSGALPVWFSKVGSRRGLWGSPSMLGIWLTSP